MRSSNQHRDHRSGVIVFFVAFGVLVAACGNSSSESTTEADATDSSPETPASAEQSAPEAQPWVAEVAAVVETMWEAESAVERLNDVYGGPSAVDTVRQRLSAISEVVATANEALPVDAPTEFEGPFDTLADAVDEWFFTVGMATDSLDASSQDLQAEIDEMGDDIGQIMEGSATSQLVAQVLDARQDVVNACFALQSAAQDIEPVIICQTGQSTPVGSGERLLVELSPAFTMAVENPGEVRAFADAVEIGDPAPFLVISTNVELADPEGEYFDLFLTPTAPPADFQAWIDATTVISVVEQGRTDVDGIEARWWTVTGDAAGIEAATGISIDQQDFVGLYLPGGGRDIAEQIWPGRELTIWVIPHPEATLYAFGSSVAQVSAILESIAFEG